MDRAGGRRVRLGAAARGVRHGRAGAYRGRLRWRRSPARRSSRTGPDHGTLRLCFATQTPDGNAEGLRRLDKGFAAASV
ncbi:hypothetical protein Sdia_15020 [Streptomyces diastaticus subsp. diastaticus]|uniref:Uncharacterized protein n=2 Tax=Streptomyces diastaticus group TaxID=2849069 RepID=A0A8H9HIY7_9ACTN|nr:hypothetical protein Srut_16550 [Streptomyces rutgersensis]GFH70734.1 hypothetical protein Sdia_15020 [Streptomyces diastaticus subsp. diastaticus]GGU61474.1 hypothetical protein GCM10010227_13470 [Streptomyces gougerotii]